MSTPVIAVPIPDELTVIAGLDRVDYADAFRAHATVDRTPEQYARLAVRSMPSSVMGLVWAAHRALGLRIGARGAPGRALGWQVVRSDERVFVMAASGPLMTPRVITSVAGGEVTVATLIRFESPAAAPIWAAIGPIHRAVERQLVERGASAASDR